MMNSINGKIKKIKDKDKEVNYEMPNLPSLAEIYNQSTPLLGYGFDPLALVELITPVEGNKDGLKRSSQLVSEPGGSRSRIYKVFEVEPMKEKEGIVVIWLGKNPNSSRVWPFLGVVHNSSKDAHLSEASATIIGSNRVKRSLLLLCSLCLILGEEKHQQKGVKRSRSLFLLLLNHEEYMSTADMVKIGGFWGMLCDYILILLMYLVNAAMFTLVLLRIAINTVSTARLQLIDPGVACTKEILLKGEVVVIQGDDNISASGEALLYDKFDTTLIVLSSSNSKILIGITRLE
ncbi:hypothetical protein Tco_0150257 [Tanacetum coccineum]